MLELSSLDMDFEPNSESNETMNTLVVNVHNKVMKYLACEPSICDPTPSYQVSSWNENNINLKGPIKPETSM